MIKIEREPKRESQEQIEIEELKGKDFPEESSFGQEREKQNLESFEMPMEEKAQEEPFLVDYH